MDKVKRKYESVHRKTLAGQTRTQILDSARRLFRDHGYATTTIDAIAKDAGVSTPTVYSTFGGKRAMLVTLLDEMEQVADAASVYAQLDTNASDPRAQLSIFIDFSVRLFTAGADLMRIGELAGLGDPDVANLWKVGNERRMESCQRTLLHWEERGVFREGLTASQALDILWSITGPEFYSLFIRGRSWSPEQFKQWLFQFACQQLLP